MILIFQKSKHLQYSHQSKGWGPLDWVHPIRMRLFKSGDLFFFHIKFEKISPSSDSKNSRVTPVSLQLTSSLHINEASGEAVLRNGPAFDTSFLVFLLHVFSVQWDDSGAQSTTFSAICLAPKLHWFNAKEIFGSLQNTAVRSRSSSQLFCLHTLLTINV